MYFISQVLFFYFLLLLISDPDVKLLCFLSFTVFFFPFYSFIFLSICLSWLHFVLIVLVCLSFSLSIFFFSLFLSLTLPLLFCILYPKSYFPLKFHSYQRRSFTKSVPWCLYLKTYWQEYPISMHRFGSETWKRKKNYPLIRYYRIRIYYASDFPISSYFWRLAPERKREREKNSKYIKFQRHIVGGGGERGGE